MWGLSSTTDLFTIGAISDDSLFMDRVERGLGFTPEQRWGGEDAHILNPEADIFSMDLEQENLQHQHHNCLTRKEIKDILEEEMFEKEQVDTVLEKMDTGAGELEFYDESGDLKITRIGPANLLII